jgi:eukaryotic-like serine/threonine-protein kinase
MASIPRKSTQCTECGSPLRGSLGLSLCGACSFQQALGLDEVSPDADEGVLRRFGDYDLLEETGRGGMGVVYRARQRSLDRIVALKVLLGGHFAGEDGRKRFQTEAEATARLRHPGLVAIHEAGEVDGQPFYSMDFVEGRTLAQEIRAGPMTSARAARIAEHIARAVHHAHLHGILHRDLKPSNVLLDAADEPHVTDFGLAKLFDEASRGNRSLTMTGQVVGSPAWMAPEQAFGQPDQLTPSADVYSLGSMLYEMLTGRPPFHGETPQAIFEQARTADPVTPRRLNASVPRDLETVCLHCLEKQPSHRYASALLLADDLARFQAGEPVHARPIGPAGRAWRWAQRHRAAAAALAAIILALAAVIAVMAVTSIRVSHARAAADRRAEESRRHLIRSHIVAGNHFLDSGNTQHALPCLLEAWKLETDPERRNIQAVRLATALAHSPQPARIWPTDSSVTSLRFSADGKRIVCANGTTKVRVWSAARGADDEVTLVHDAPVYAADFNLDGSRVLTADPKAAYLWNAADGARIAGPFPHDGSVDNVAMRIDPPFSPDGHSFLTCAGQSVQPWSAITGQPLSPAANMGAKTSALCFFPDGQRALVANLSSELRVVDFANGATMGLVFRLREPSRAVSVNAAGTRASALMGQYRLAFLPLDDPAAPLLEAAHDPGAYTYQCDFLRDGERVFSTSYDGTARIWNGTTGQLLQVLQHPIGILRSAVARRANRAATPCWDGAARVWSLSSGKINVPPVLHGAPVQAVDLNAEGNALVSAGNDGTVRLYHLPTEAPITARGRFQCDSTQPARAAVQWQDERTLVVADPRTGSAISPPMPHLQAVSAVSLSVSCARLATLTTDGMVTLWDTTTGKSLREIPPGAAPIDGVLLTSDGARLLRVLRGGKVQLHDTSDGRLLGKTLVAPAPMHFRALSPDGRWFAAAGADLKVRVWSTADGRAIGSPFAPDGGAQAFWWSADGTRLAVASGPADRMGKDVRVMQIFDPVLGTAVTPPMIHFDDIMTARFSPDGRWLATGCEDCRARLFDAKTGALAGAPMAHDGFVITLAFNPRGTLLASGSRDAEIRIWEVPSGQSAAHGIKTPSAASEIFFGPNDSSLTGLYGTGGRHVFRTATLALPANAATELPELAAAVSGFRMDQEGTLRAIPADELIALWRRVIRK